MLIKNLERKIWDLEGFAVRVRLVSGRDARDDRQVLANLQCEHRAEDGMTVQQWKEQRFRMCFPAHEVEVLLAHGAVAQGDMLLGSVRDSYDYEPAQ